MARKTRKKNSSSPVPPASAQPKKSYSLAFAPALFAAALVAGGYFAWQYSSHKAAAPSLAAAPVAPAQYAGSATCAACHANEYAAWQTSQHQLAMQHADEKTVLGDFNNASFTHQGVTTRLFRRDGRFMVNTDGADGKLADFEIKYTFGVAPLQQYLIEFPGGRLQALSVAWDSNKKRWFHSHESERIDHRDVLHWTRTSQNWNTMCADCHSTALKKNYDPATNSFHTVYAEISVGCEACHGPASKHIEWTANKSAVDKGLAVDFHGASSTQQVESCAGCHALRATLTAQNRPGETLLDRYLPVQLGGEEYFPDGQQREEVFIYGSWMQSKMHQKGLRCSDCHDVHSGKLRAPGNAMCTTCHNAAGPAAGPHIDTRELQRKNYDGPEHHHHAEAITCVACHAPKRTYMVVDPRLDHSFRIPRPDLSDSTGSPNACNNCHQDKSSSWAADAVARWYGPGRQQSFHYGEAFAKSQHGQPGAAAALLRVAEDLRQPAFVRAGAIEQLGRYPGQQASQAIMRALNDADAQVRIGALRASAAFDPATRVRALAPLLSDPVRAVRIEASSEMSPLSSSFDPVTRAAWSKAVTEFEAAQLENADRPQSPQAMAMLSVARGDLIGAEGQLRRALMLEPMYVPARVNLADLLRRTGKESEGEKLLREGLQRMPKDASLNEALALSLVRQGRKPEALALLQKTAKASDVAPRIVYIYAISLADAGRRREAIAVLDKAAEHMGDRDILLALAGLKHEAGDQAGSAAALARLQAINPEDPALSAR